MMPSIFIAMVAMPKLLYTLRSAPCFLSSLLNDSDDLQCAVHSDITNVHKAPAWSQASLPVKYDGLGVRRAALSASQFFLSSASGSSDLIHQILPERLQHNPRPASDAGLQVWKQCHSNPPPSSR